MLLVFHIYEHVNLSQTCITILQEIPDTDVKQKNKNMKQYLITLNALTQNNNFLGHRKLVQIPVKY